MAISARMQTTRLKSAVHPKILSSSQWHNENWSKPSFDASKNAEEYSLGSTTKRDEGESGVRTSSRA